MASSPVVDVATSPAQAARDGVTLRVRVTPKSSRDEVLAPTWQGGELALKVRVRAVPEDGKANKAVTRLIAKWLGVAGSTVVLKSGARSRTKLLEIHGHSNELTATIDRLLDVSKN